MTITHMYDLRIEQLDDGTVRLEQSAGSLEGAAIVELHPCQLRLLAEQAGLLEQSPIPGHLDTDADTGEMHHLQVAHDDDGTVHLYQTQLRGMGGSDEHVILHPTQAAWLGARLLAIARSAKPHSSPLGASLMPPEGECPVSAAKRDSGPSDLFDEGATR